MNTELLNRINMNDVYVKEFINNATDEQMEFFDIAAKLLSNNNDMSVIFDYTDDEHLRLITNKLIEYKNSEFVQRLKNVKYIEDIKELVTIMPNDDVFDTYIMSIVKQNDEYNDLRKNNSDLSWDEIERKYPEDRSEMSEEREMLFMKKTRVKLIVKEFYKQMNPDMWDGSGERPDSFDTHAWEYPLTDAVHLELAFGYDESDGGWKYFCDLVHSSDNSSFDMTSGHEINSPQNMINSVMQLCREYE